MYLYVGMPSNVLYPCMCIQVVLVVGAGPVYVMSPIDIRPTAVSLVRLHCYTHAYMLSCQVKFNILCHAEYYQV